MTLSSPVSAPDAPGTLDTGRRAAFAHALGLRPPGLAAPPWSTSAWFNSPAPLDLPALRGQVVVLHAFQMLCPACVQHGLPQAQRIHARFGSQGVAVVGLHTVFEHHAAMTPVSLQAFLHEYRISFPVGVDAASASGSSQAQAGIPLTMQAYGMQGTPTLVLIDRQGHLRRHSFGAEDDMVVAAAIACLLTE